MFAKQLKFSDQNIGLMQELIQAIQMAKITVTERFWYRRVKTVKDTETKRLVQAKAFSFISALF